MSPVPIKRIRDVISLAMREDARGLAGLLTLMVSGNGG
jgi:hypothetical protein